MRWLSVNVTLYDTGSAIVETRGVDVRLSNSHFCASHARGLEVAQERSRAYAANGWRVPVTVDQAAAVPPPSEAAP